MGSCLCKEQHTSMSAEDFHVILNRRNKELLEEQRKMNNASNKEHLDNMHGAMVQGAANSVCHIWAPMFSRFCARHRVQLDIEDGKDNFMLPIYMSCYILKTQVARRRCTTLHDVLQFQQGLAKLFHEHAQLVPYLCGEEGLESCKECCER